MTIRIKTGIVALTVLMKHGCSILTKYRPAIDGAIAAAVSEGLITSSQQTQLQAFLNLFSGACDIIRLVSGY